ncbi:MAG: M14-type cytosolic carboxypeptidase [Planctomycetota bacterium]|nr:M14-type cytosolic carboxypeptidase [Planctomycetota bacterium]
MIMHAPLLLVLALAAAAAPAEPAAKPALDFISTAFENASPLNWEVDADGTVHIYLLYDYERSSPNRAAGHWHFQVQAAKGSDLTFVLHNFDNIWNGHKASPVSEKTIAYLSHDGRKWTVIPTEKLEGNLIRFRVHMESDSLYVARVEPYRLSDLERLLAEIRGHPLVEVTPIGSTVEGRPLEIIRVGRPDAPHRVLLRARAHAWEPGGNWVVEGLVRSLLADDAENRRYLGSYCVYIMPLANKDGVARGWTRFNVAGKDINRNWDKPADPKLSPENHALEAWLEAMAAKGKRIELAIDLHNDENGKLNVSRPAVDLERHLARMQQLETLLRKHTWFTEGSTGAGFRNPGSLGEGLLERYGIDACVLELNCNWIAGLKQHPSGEAWMKLGRDLREVFFGYFQSP